MASLPPFVPVPAVTPVVATVLHHRDALYDVILLAHVLAALVSLVAVVVAGSSALALVGATDPSPAVRRYYDGRTNWLGRLLFAVPVLGAVLVAMSSGDWTYGDSWVLLGLVLWVVAAMAAEMELWPAELRVARHLEEGRPVAELRGLGLRTAGVAGGVGLLLVAAAVVMVAKP